MGGAIASLIALRAQDRVASLTLVAPGGFGPEIDDQALRRYGLAVEVNELAVGLAAMAAQAGAHETAGLDQLAAARRIVGATDRLMEILQSFLVKTDERIGQGTLPLPLFASLGIPTRLLWGTADPILPVAQAKNIWEGAEVTLIETAGHMLVDEAPDRVAAAIRAAMAEG